MGINSKYCVFIIINTYITPCFLKSFRVIFLITGNFTRAILSRFRPIRLPSGRHVPATLRSECFHLALTKTYLFELQTEPDYMQQTFTQALLSTACC